MKFLAKCILYLVAVLHVAYRVYRMSRKVFIELPDGQPYGRRVNKVAFYLLFARRVTRRCKNLVALRFAVKSKTPVLITRNLGEDLLREAKGYGNNSDFYLFGLTFKDDVPGSVVEMLDPYKDPNKIYTWTDTNWLYHGFTDVVNLHADAYALLNTRSR